MWLCCAVTALLDEVGNLGLIDVVKPKIFC